jgi:Ca-activated chloride channel family protein
MKRALAALALAAVSVGWLDPYHQAREGNRLYAEGKYDDAASRYSEALVDHPDSPLLHFNLGDAAYKQGKYDDALKAYAEVPPDDGDPARTARVAYNVGNAKVRQGEAAEASDPKTALTRYAEALVAYRRAMGAAPDDPDPKFNHELVEKKIADLKKKLEEQKQKQDQQQQQKQQKKDQPQDQNGQAPQPGDKGQDQQGQQDQKDQQDQQDQQGKEQKDGEQQPQAAPSEPQPTEAQQAQAAQKSDGQMSPQDAAALLDGQRTEEVRPDEVVKRLQGGVVAEPAEDW